MACAAYVFLSLCPSFLTTNAHFESVEDPFTCESSAGDGGSTDQLDRVLAEEYTRLQTKRPATLTWPVFFLWSLGESNSRHPACKAGTLPTELRPRCETIVSRIFSYYVFGVGLPGLEPGTSSLSAKRSNHLSYSPECASETLPERTGFLKSRREESIQLLVKPTRTPPVIFTERL